MEQRSFVIPLAENTKHRNHRGMSQIATTIDAVRQAAERDGLPRLALEAGVPYTTVKSFADRGWQNKSLAVFEKLADAAGRLNEVATQEAA